MGLHHIALGRTFHFAGNSALPFRQFAYQRAGINCLSVELAISALEVMMAALLPLRKLF
jgi:hypothetical protein